MTISNRESALVLRQLQKMQLRQTKLMEELASLKSQLSDVREEFDEKFMECDALGDTIRRLDREFGETREDQLTESVPSEIKNQESSSLKSLPAKQVSEKPSVKKLPSTMDEDSEVQVSGLARVEVPVPETTEKGSTVDAVKTSAVPMKASSRFSGAYDREAYMWALVENELRRWLIDRRVWSHQEWLDLLKMLTQKGYDLDFTSKSVIDRAGKYLEAHRPQKNKMDLRP